MATIYINDSRNPTTKYDTVNSHITEKWGRCGGASKTSSAMHNILDDARINTNDTFVDQGKTEVPLDEWNKEFTRNVEFIMANSDDATAVGNLKHYGFRP